MLYRVEALVIRTMDYGEGNKIVTLFSRELGKVGVMARGAKKLKNRLTAPSQLFTCGGYVIYKTRASLGTLNHGEIEHAFQRLRENLLLAAVASYLMELTDRMLEDGERQPDFFDQLKAGLLALEDGKDPHIVMHALELRLLRLGGYQPELGGCVECGRTEGPFRFGPRHGGLLCYACASRVETGPYGAIGPLGTTGSVASDVHAGLPARDAGPEPVVREYGPPPYTETGKSASYNGEEYLSPPDTVSHVRPFPAGERALPPGRPIPLTDGALRLLRLLGDVDLRRLGRIDVKPETKALLKLCLRRYMDEQTELRLKSRHFLDQIDRHGLE